VDRVTKLNTLAEIIVMMFIDAANTNDVLIIAVQRDPKKVSHHQKSSLNRVKAVTGAIVFSSVLGIK